MKLFSRIFSILLVLLVLSSLSFAEGSLTALDLSKASVEDILEMQSKIGEELYDRGESAQLFQGQYRVGKDIAPGSYILTAYSIDYSKLWKVTIYASLFHLNALIEAKEKGEKVNTPNYIEFYKECFGDNTMRITLVDRQVLDITFGGKMNVVISKAPLLFGN